MKVLDDHLVTLICDLLCRDSKVSRLLGKAGVFACPSNYHLETDDFEPEILATCA